MSYFVSPYVLENTFTPISHSINGGVDTISSTDDTVADSIKNVVVIVLESFSEEYIGYFNNRSGESFTPFLDSLIQKSII